MWGLALRVNTMKDKAWRRNKWTSRVFRRIRDEATPCIMHEKLLLSWKPETYLFVAVSWWTSIITATHVLWGTIAFSSLQFLGYVDSIQIIARFMGSAIVCRAVLMFELAGMRNALEERSGDQDYSLVGLASTATSSSHHV